LRKTILALLVSSTVLLGCSTEEVEPVIERITEDISVSPERVMELTFFMGESQTSISEEALSMDVAGRSGSNWLMNLLDVDLDGMFVEMTYHEVPISPHFSDKYWVGNIAESESILSVGEFLYQFRIDARTGRLLDLIRYDEVEVLEAADFPILEEEDIARYTNVARGFIERFIFGDLREINFVENSDLPASSLFFIADISQGNVLEITIQRETGDLLRMETFHRPGSGVSGG